MEKKPAWTADVKRAAVEPELATINVARQCELPGLARSTYCYALAGESAENLTLLFRGTRQRHSGE